MTRKEILKENVSSISEYKNKTFTDLLKESFCTIKPSKRRRLIIFFVIVLIIYPIKLCVASNNTLIYIKEFVGLSNGIIMAMFAILFTGYALFQALIGRNTLKILFLSKSENKRVLFLEYNLYFFAMCILYVSLILINYIILFMLIVVPPSIFININEDTKNIILGICIFIYLYIYIFAITEIKSFIVNLFRCFNISAMSTMIDALRNYDDNLHEKDNKQ